MATETPIADERTDAGTYRDELMLVGPTGVLAPWTLGTGGPLPPQKPEVLTTPFDPKWLLHSFRRRWVLATGLGLLAAGVCAAVVWIITPSKAEAVALLEVAARPPRIAFAVEKEVPSDFDTFKRTQITLFKSPFVMQAALRKNNIAQTSLLRDEPDQVNALADMLDVSFPGNGEILRVALLGEAQSEVQAIVQAVTDAFMEEVVEADRQDQIRTKNLLERSFHTTTEKIRQKTQAYKKLAHELYTNESQEARFDRNMAITELNELRAEKSRLQQELMAQRTKVTVLKAHRTDPALLAAKVDELIEADPQIMQMREQLDGIEALYIEQRSRARRADTPALARLDEQRRTASQQLVDRRAELRPRLMFELENKPDAAYNAEVKELQIRQQVATARVTELNREIDRLTLDVKRLGEQSLELDALEVELAQLRKAAGVMGSQIEAWQVEIDSPPRIRRMSDGQPSVTPGIATFQRYLLVGFGGVLGFFITAAGISFLEFQSRRLNNSEQVADGLGLQVVGELPPLADRSHKKGVGGSAAMLTEAIDGVRTWLMHNGHSKKIHVVMVTSGSGHEGKTTVASQLAASLARSGRRTLVVDADLRDPSLHHVLGAPLDGGVCDVLRREADLRDVIRPTDLDDLWLLTAGHFDLASMQAVAQDRLGPIFEQLRADFDYVIVDTGPVLNLTESLMVGQYTDGALLSVRRDVSRVPEIHEATTRLRSVGIEVLGTIVNGSRTPMRDRASQLRLASHQAEQGSAV